MLPPSSPRGLPGDRLGSLDRGSLGIRQLLLSRPMLRFRWIRLPGHGRSRPLRRHDESPPTSSENAFQSLLLTGQFRSTHSDDTNGRQRGDDSDVQEYRRHAMWMHVRGLEEILHTLRQFLPSSLFISRRITRPDYIILQRALNYSKNIN